MNSDVGITTSMVRAAGVNASQSSRQNIVKSSDDQKSTSGTVIAAQSVSAKDEVARIESEKRSSETGKSLTQDSSTTRLYKHTDSAPAQERHDFAAKRAKHSAISFLMTYTQARMKEVGSELKSQVESAIPELAGQEYGISIDKKGELTFIGNNIDESHNKTLNELSGADALKDIANQFVSAMVDWTEADKELDGSGVIVGGVEVTRENFGELVDITATLEDKTIAEGYFHYLIDKYDGKHGFNEDHDRSSLDEYRNGEWVRLKTKGEWVNTKV